jgi:GxxExxY protein
MKYYFPAENTLLKSIALEVWNQLGSGFTKEIYADALELELTLNKIQFKRNTNIPIYYKKQLLPHTYTADFIIDEKILLFIQAKQGISEFYKREIISMLQAAKLNLGIYINYTYRGAFFNRLTVGSKFITSGSLAQDENPNLPSSLSGLRPYLQTDFKEESL